MTAIRKSQIIGARIIEISYTYRTTEDGLDECLMYFTVDRGFSFLMPFAGVQWESSEVPREAKPFGQPRPEWLARLLKSREQGILDQIRMGTIAGVLGSPEYPDDTVIVLNDGAQVSNTMVAPHGTGAAGLYYRRRSEQTASIDHLRDFFDIPPDSTDPAV